MNRQGPLSILYTAWAPFFSGAERALVILLENLDPSRYRPIVALGTRGELARELETRGVRTVHVPVVYTGVRTMPLWLATMTRLLALCRRERVRLVHANDAPSFQTVGYAARLLGLPAVTHIRFPDSRAGFGWMLKPGFTHALFVSAALRDLALTEAPALFSGRSDVVHDGVRLPDLPDSAARAKLRLELGLPLDRTVIALTGQISEIKGIWEFIDAAAALVSAKLPVFFAILGDDLKGKGALRRRAEELVREKGLEPHVRFLGFRPNAPALIPAFDIVAVPSHVEPLGNATLEAMAAGLPVVGSRVGGIPEMIVDGETGLLVPSRDSAALAQAIESLVRDPLKGAAFGRAGRARAAATFSPAAHAQQVERAYARFIRM